MTQVIPRPFGETMDGAGAGGWCVGVPLLLLLLVPYSTALAFAPPPVTGLLGATPALALSLLFQHSLPFLKCVSTEAPQTHLLCPVLGCNGSVLSVAEPAVSGPGQSLASCCTDETMMPSSMSPGSL